jgi:hypothetical protein
VNPAAVNQEVQFTINAQGSNLLSLVLNYGDGTNDDLQSIVGSRTARWVNPHTFVTAGQYTVTATINELSDTTSRTITMTVNPVAGTSTSIPRVFDVK